MIIKRVLGLLRLHLPGGCPVKGRLAQVCQRLYSDIRMRAMPASP
mgnify:CR=1 FL=1